MGVIATFSYATWIARYPEFELNVQPPLAALYFAEAGLYHNNDGTGPINDPNMQLLLMNMVTAHIAALNAPRKDGEPAPTIVGRITDASEGSVSVSTEYGTLSQSQAFWVQTKYGAAYWQATASIRTMHYHPGHPRRFDAFPRGRWW